MVPVDEMKAGLHGLVPLLSILLLDQCEHCQNE